MREDCPKCKEQRKRSKQSAIDNILTPDVRKEIIKMMHEEHINILKEVWEKVHGRD